MGAAYDVFGNGKTAIKVNLGKYLQAATNDENYWANNPAGRIVTSVGARGAGCDNGNYVIDCDLSNPAGSEQPGHRRRQLRAARRQRSEFRQAPTPTDDRQPRHPGEAGASVRRTGSSACRSSRSLRRACPLNVGYNRRWFWNFFVTDNHVTTAADYDQWTFTAPQNPALPVGGSTLTTTSTSIRRHRDGRAELSDVRDRLRAGTHAVLARRGRQRERAAAQRLHGPGRHDHRPWRA